MTVGYSCFFDAKNTLLHHNDKLLQTILTHPQIHSWFHYIDAKQQVVWKTTSCFKYMEACHQVEMMLFASTQTSVGEPGQGIEIALHLISNVSGSNVRNVFIMFQYFCMMGTFSKSSHLTE